MTSQIAKRRVPLSHYVLAIAFGAIATIALSLAVGASNPDDYWLAAGICAMCAAYPALSLGIRIFVTDHTISRDAHGEESVELTWLRRATAGAFLDVLVTTIVAAITLMLAHINVDALPVLLVLAGLGAVDAGIRYLVIRHHALK